MEANNKCLLCNNTENVIYSGNMDSTVECPICGKYQFDINLLVKTDWENISEELRQKIRYKVKKNHTEQLKKTGTQKLFRQSLIITEEEINNIDNSITIPSLLEKIDLVMDYIEENTNFIAEKVYINVDSFFPLFFCKNNYELNQILDYLKSEDLIKFEKTEIKYKKVEIDDIPIRELTDYIYNYYISSRTKEQDGKMYFNLPSYNWIGVVFTQKGLLHQKNRQKNFLNSKQCFVAMWFNDRMESIYESCIKPAIESSDGKYKPIKINDVHHTNDINDEIISQIKKSRFIVVDLTGYRGGVYFEAGYAFGLGMPVIYTCHKDWLERKLDVSGNLEREGVHFDINHRNILLWTDDPNDLEYEKYSLDNLKKNLTSRINAVT